MTPMLRLLAIPFSFLLFASTAFADLHKFAVIDGVSQELVLKKNHQLDKYRTPGSNDAHYEGHILGEPLNWARVSRIGDHWDGIVVYNGTIYMIHHLADSANQTRSANKYEAETINNPSSLGTDGIRHVSVFPRSSNNKSLTTANVLSPVSVNYPSYCTSTVNGVCIVADLTVVFDSSFQSDFPGTYTSVAGDMLNQLDGYYKSQLQIVFKRLDIDFTHGSQFTSSNNPGDILKDMEKQRVNGETSSFDPNVNSIMHLVTGRDFTYNDGTTTYNNVVGLANTPVYTASNYPNTFTPILCSGGYTVGTSQVITYQGSLSPSLTALIMTHEIGHNFGAEHDGDPNSITAASCTETNKIMYYQLVPGATEFSTCSKNAISTNISRLPNVDQCFQFPIDASLTADVTNNAQVGANATVQHNFEVGVNSANGQNGPVLVHGSITSGDGSFTGVTLAGNDCTLENNNTSYSCTLNSAASNNTLAVSFTTGNTNLNMVLSTNVNSPLYDMDTSNDGLMDNVIVSGPNLPPTSLTATYSSSTGNINLLWQDHSTNETGFQVERKINDGPWQVVNGSLAPNTTQYVDNQGVLNATLQYRVSALFGTTVSTPTNIASVIYYRVLDPYPDAHHKKGGSLAPWLLVPVLLRLRRRKVRH